jgi:hypothetical protein
MKSFLQKLSETIKDSSKQTEINTDGHLIIAKGELCDLVITKDDCDTKRIENLIKKMKKYNCEQVNEDDPLLYRIPSRKVLKWESEDSDKNSAAAKNKHFRVYLLKMINHIEQLEIDNVKNANKLFNVIIKEVVKVFPEADDYNLIYNQSEVVLQFEAGHSDVKLTYEAEHRKLGVSF